MNDTPTKRCTKCSQELPATSEYFYKQGNGLQGVCIECVRERNRHWYIANQDTAREQVRLYSAANRKAIREQKRLKYAANREEEREKRHRWYQANREAILERLRREYAANPEVVLQRNRRRREANREAYRERSRLWKKANPDKVRANVQQRRARKHNAPGSYTTADIQLQYESQKSLCWWCGCKLDDTFQVDHRVPLSRGGSNAPENLVISCAKCNLSKYNKLPGEWNGRLL